MRYFKSLLIGFLDTLFVGGVLLAGFLKILFGLAPAVVAGTAAILTIVGAGAVPLVLVGIHFYRRQRHTIVTAWDIVSAYLGALVALGVLTYVGFILSFSF